MNAPRDRTLTYQPALDGVRAVAVLMVLLFHHGVSWMSGGYVGVSVFFTLSGYLITALLATERDTSGAISVGRFYVRRARRLLPASFACIALVMVARGFGEFEQVANLRRDILGALFQVANWVKLGGGASYAELLNNSTGQRGPLEHYWSLAIEEQFYWIWPLAFLAISAAARSGRRRLFVVAGLTVVFAGVAPMVAAVWGTDAVYWATPARIGEILVGASLALWQRGRTSAIGPRAAWVGVPSLAVIVWAATTWGEGSGPAYAGWLPMFALASAGLVLAVQVDSPLRRALATRPLVKVGAISYGLYLYHWPVFVVLGETRTGLNGVALLALRVAVTAVIATVSFVVLERPIREQRVSLRLSLTGGLAVSAALGALAIVVVPSTVSTYYVPDDDAVRAVEIDAAAPTGALTPATTTVPATAPAGRPPASAVDTRPSTIPAPTQPASPASTVLVHVPVPVPALEAPSRPVRTMVIGDSTAWSIGTGLVDWALAHPAHMQVSLEVEPGCGFVRGGVILGDGDIPWQDRCDTKLDHDVPAALVATPPDVVVLMVTIRDVEDRQWSEAEGPLTALDPRFEQRLYDDYLAFAGRLARAGVPRVTWILAPLPTAPFEGEMAGMRDPRRYEPQDRVIRRVAARFPDMIRVIDLDSWMADRYMIWDHSVRPDGLHFEPGASLDVAEQFLAPSVIAAALD